jgi:hypothetical protein
MERLKTFEEFWPFYVSQHRLPTTRALHFAGTTMVLAALAIAVVRLSPLWVLAALVLGYGPAWIGHFFFEKNRPATFTYPLYSFMGDWAMWRDVLARKISL